MESDLFAVHSIFDHRQDNGNYEIHSEHGDGNDGVNKTGATILAPGQYLLGTGFKARTFRELVRYSPSALESLNRCKDSPAPLLSISLTSQDVTRWKMAWRVIEEHGRNVNHDELTYEDFNEYSELTHEDSSDYSELKYFIIQRCLNWPNMEEISKDFPIALAFSAAALAYGGLHALAWFAHFASTTDQLLWRISACVVMSGVPVGLVLLRFTDGYLMYLPHLFFYRFGGTVMGLVLLAYVLARGYLVVECFINLSHLPAEVYNVPTWSGYFPHIS